MRLTLFVFLCFALGLAPGLAAAEEKAVRHVEKAGGFSWVSPKGWKMTDPAKEADAAIKTIQDMKKKIEAKRPADRTPAEKTQLDAFDKVLKAAALAKGAVKKYQTAWGPEGPIPAPSVTFDEFVGNGEKGKTTLADCAAFYKKAPADLSDDEKDGFTVLGERKLKTDAGAECAVVVVTYGSWRVTYYCFDLGKGRFLVATCSASRGITDQAEKLDPVFDACIKTFRMEKP